MCVWAVGRVWSRSERSYKLRWRVVLTSYEINELIFPVSLSLSSASSSIFFFCKPATHRLKSDGEILGKDITLGISTLDDLFALRKLEIGPITSTDWLWIVFVSDPL